MNSKRTVFKRPSTSPKLEMDFEIKTPMHIDEFAEKTKKEKTSLHFKSMPTCPVCNAKVKKIIGPYGVFYGCENFRKTGCTGKRTAGEIENYNNKGKPKKEQRDIDIPNDDKNVKLIDTNKFPLLDFPFEKFNPVQSKVFKYYDKDVNMVIAAATSAGKTTVAEMAIAHAIKKGKKGIFLSPLKAVSNEKYDDWTDPSHGFSKLNISIVTGDYGTLTPARVKELNNADVIIMTTEMLDSRTRRITSEKNDWLLETGALVCDEFHLITMEGRGDKVESAVMRFTEQNPACRVIALSATMPNVSELAEWLTSLNKKKTELINSSYRPCKLDVHYVPYTQEKKYYDTEENKMEGVLKILDEHINDKFIVFVHTKNTGKELIKKLEDKGENVRFHNAELSKQDRDEITKDFKSSLRIIVATSTLAWGVNLPARRVIVTGIHRGMGEVSVIDVKQEVGRAGRVGLDPKGDSYILVPHNGFDHYKDWCENIPPITSVMCDSDVLAFHVVSEIQTGEVYDVRTLIRWYNRSLAAFQNDYLNEAAAQELLTNLEQYNSIRRVNDKYVTTDLGEIASNFYYSPYMVSGLYFNFDKIFSENRMNDEDISWAMSNFKQENGFFLPKLIKENELGMYTSYLAENKLKTIGESSAVGLLYLSCLGNDRFIPDSLKYHVKGDLERVMTVLKMVDKKFAEWGKQTFFRNLEMRIQYEITEEMTELCSLKHVGSATVRKLFAAGIKTIEDFKTQRGKGIGALKSFMYQKILVANNLQ